MDATVFAMAGGASTTATDNVSMAIPVLVITTLSVPVDRELLLRVFEAPLSSAQHLPTQYQLKKQQHNKSKHKRRQYEH